MDKNDKIYCVYEWYNVLTGEIFYVGSGTEERARRRGATRSKAVKKKLDELFTLAESRILFRNLTKEESLAKEKEVIQDYAKHGVELLNVVNYVAEKREYDNTHFVCPCCGEVLAVSIVNGRLILQKTRNEKKHFLLSVQ